MGCKIGNLVRETIPTLDGNATVVTAVQLMSDRRVGSVLITGDTGITGLFTERDLVTRVMAPGKDPAQLPLREVATTQLVSIADTASCRDAIQKMQTHSCRRLVVYRDGRIVGLVRMQDVAHAMAQQGGGKDLLLNLIGGITLLVVLAFIGMLLYHLPDMLRLAERLSG